MATSKIISAVETPVPFPVEKVRKYVWYSRFHEILGAIERSGVTDRARQFDLLEEIEKAIEKTATESVMGLGSRKYRRRTYHLVEAELKGWLVGNDILLPSQPKLESFAQLRLGVS